MATQQHTEPDIIVTGCLSKALELLGPELGPYVAAKTGDSSLASTQDVHAILYTMTRYEHWRRDYGCFTGLGRTVQNWADELYAARNSWAHQESYNYRDAHRWLDNIARLLKAIGANERASEVEEMRDQVGRLIYGTLSGSTTEPQPPNPFDLLKEAFRGQDFIDIIQVQISEAVRANLPQVLGQDALTDGTPITPDDRSDDTLHESSTDDAEFHRNCGTAHLREHNYDEAIASFDRVIELASDDARGYAARGYAYAQKGSNDLAIADYTKAIELAPDNSRGYGLRGAIYARQEDYDLAVDDYNKAIELSPNDGHNYHIRGRMYANQGEYDLAIADCSHSIKINPDDAHAYRLRGLAYARKGDYGQAITDFNKAIQLDPNNGPSHVEWWGRSCQSLRR